MIGILNRNTQSWDKDDTRTDANGDEQLYLKIIFDRKGLVSLLHKAGQAIWSPKRPVTLVWLSFDSDKAASDKASQIETMMVELKNVAQQRGIPIIFPTTGWRQAKSHDFNEDQSFKIGSWSSSFRRMRFNWPPYGHLDFLRRFPG